MAKDMNSHDDSIPFKLIEEGNENLIEIDPDMNSHDDPIPFKLIEEANVNLIQIDPPQGYSDLINTLPVRSYNSVKLRLYEGFWLREFFVPGAITMKSNFQSRPDDLFLASYPKCGTTWLKALVFAVMTRTSYPLNQHPLLTYNSHECIGLMDCEFSLGRSSLLEAVPSPRVLNTHLPHSLLPDSITESNCQIIYICRDPKDAFISLYHFGSQISEKGVPKASLDELFPMFCDGVSSYGPIWDHALSYWKKSVERPEKFLFIKYEEMLLDPKKHVRRLAEFIARPFSEAEEEQGVIDQIVELCSFEKLKNLEVNKASYKPILSDDFYVSRKAFFRKGVVGDWRNHMSREMAQRLDSIVDERFKGSGLEIPAESRST